MSLDNIREPFHDPAQRDDFEDVKRQGFKKYVSPWVRIDAGSSYQFPHGLLEIPHVVSTLEATDAQGAAQAEATSVTITKTVTMVAVANAGAARFFRVRAF